MTTSAEPPTIYAPATAPGRAAVAIVRISGPHAFVTAEAIAGTLPPPRRLARRRLVEPTTQRPLDEALVVRFPAPSSATGEDVVELHLHGGALATRRVLDVLSGFADLEPATPGAFSRRAFLHGRLDLTQAEAVADLIDAETEAQARQALRQLDGMFGRRLAEWRRRLLALRAPLEATLDFADEGDVADAAEYGDTIGELAAELGAAIADDRGERVRVGLRIALVGVPNAGKSSLLNALAQRDAAIVTAVPGTTRDVLEVPLELGGLPVTVVDMAGLRETSDPIEAEGVRRAEAAAAGADLRLHLIDGARWPDPAAAPSLAPNAGDLAVLTKDDLAPPPLARWRTLNVVRASVRRAGGLDTLVSALEEAATRLMGGAEGVWTRARHRRALVAARTCLERAGGQDDPVLRAEELRLAQRHLGAVTGDDGVDALLDQVFATFCIGK